MANYDKYDPKAGGFRAALAANFPKTDIKKVFGVGLNASGQVVKGAGASGMMGVLVLTKDMEAGDVVDIMTSGEIVSFGGAAGTAYFADPSTGEVNSTSADGKYRVGATVRADRLIVRFSETPVPAQPVGP